MGERVMKIIGHKILKLKHITKPGDWQAILSRPSAAEIGESIDEIGLIHDPVVRKQGKKHILIVGRDRVAGAELRGIEAISFKVVECTDAEALDLEEIENAKRRHDPKEKKSIMLARLARLTTEAADDEPKGKPGRPKTARGKARARVADELGISEDSVRKAEQRERRKAEATVSAWLGDHEEGEVYDPPIDDLGVDLDPQWGEQVREIQTLAKSADHAMRAIQVKLTALANCGGPIDRGRLDRVRQAATSVTHQIRSLIPDVVCPYCKSFEPLQSQCGKCIGQGWISKHDRDGVPEELWDDKDPKVFHQGTLISVEDLPE